MSLRIISPICPKYRRFWGDLATKELTPLKIVYIAIKGIVMPVSPADFEFYSRVTGIPIPNDPVARMRMAPQVYAMRRSPMSKVAKVL